MYFPCLGHIFSACCLCSLVGPEPSRYHSLTSTTCSLGLETWSRHDPLTRPFGWNGHVSVCATSSHGNVPVTHNRQSPYFFFPEWIYFSSSPRWNDFAVMIKEFFWLCFLGGVSLHSLFSCDHAESDVCVWLDVALGHLFSPSVCLLRESFHEIFKVQWKLICWPEVCPPPQLFLTRSQWSCIQEGL